MAEWLMLGQKFQQGVNAISLRFKKLFDIFFFSIWEVTGLGEGAITLVDSSSLQASFFFIYHLHVAKLSLLEHQPFYFFPLMNTYLLLSLK